MDLEARGLLSQSSVGPAIFFGTGTYFVPPFFFALESLPRVQYGSFLWGHVYEKTVSDGLRDSPVPPEARPSSVSPVVGFFSKLRNQCFRVPSLATSI